jgi:DNA-binding transcriptional MerR regulator
MGFQDYISESEAATRAGVSSRTLNRFAEAGYLQVEVEPDGLRLYSRAEIDEIFVAQQRPPLPMDESRMVSEEAVTTPLEAMPVEASAEVVAYAPETSAAQEEISPEVSAYEEPQIVASSIATETDDYTESMTATSSPAVDLSALPESVAEELTRLRHMLEAREALLSMRNSELEDLKDQRDWLQARVERLEEKGDRDQILLLSETQTIRKLISMQEQRKSTVRTLLEWVGLLPPVVPGKIPVLGSASSTMGTAQGSAHTIEVRKAANNG